MEPFELSEDDRILFKDPFNGETFPSIEAVIQPQFHKHLSDNEPQFNHFFDSSIISAQKIMGEPPLYNSNF